ncbi:MAG: Crp/Fnr family transcriptional regulator [Bacillus sp. (in: firmicutes)]
MDYTDVKMVVEHYGVIKQFKKNEYIFQINDFANHIYLLADGWVKIAQDSGEGYGVTLSLHQAGNMFGLAEPLAHISRRTKDARCLTNCQIISLDIQTLFSLIKQHPDLLLSITTTLSQNILHTQNLVGTLMNKPVPWRLASLLLDFSEEKDNKRYVNLPITHEEISFLIGCSRQSVTEILNKWRTQQFIDYNRRKVVIHDSDALFSIR